jgi:tetrapyrrole methylase family protein/MazG family protein
MTMDISLLPRIFSALRIETTPRLILIEAADLREAHVPPFPPDCPVFLLNVDTPQLAAQVKNVLRAIYPAGHSLRLVNPPAEEIAWEGPLDALEQFSTWQAHTTLYVAPLGEGTSFEAFTEIIAHLRAPDGCPWDREQTHASLRASLLEEAYEAITAIDSNDFGDMREEFGDLLLQVVLQAQIASEEGHFNIKDVIEAIYAKIIRRHPHVFGDFQVEGVQGVLQNWEKLKEAERQNNGQPHKGLLDGVPLSLPALAQAQEYQERAARVGFDWPEIEGVLEKVVEEIQEVKEAGEGEHLAEEIGDLFFALVNLARWKQVDAEAALRQANARFKRRLAYVEQQAKAQGKSLSEMSLGEMDALWEAGKANGL